MNSYTTYSELIKPTWAPPSFLFGPVWTVLYCIIAYTYIWVFVSVYKKRMPKMVALPFILNLIFNFLFTPIQFGLKNNFLASIDIVLVLITIIWAMCVVYRYKRSIAYAQIPYLLWVSFATVLQIAITWMNW